MKEITTDNAPESIGPYSQAIQSGERIYISGQGPVDSNSGEIVSDNVEEQTAQTVENIEAILSAASASLDDVVKTTIFLTDMNDYEW